MRQNIKNFAEIVSATLPVVEPIYEFGSLQVPEQIGFSDLRPLFPRKDYVGCDMREGLGVDKILDLHAIDLPSGSVGAVLCFDTLEHVEYPHKALEEIHRILKPDGMVVISSVMDFPIHDYPHDYWRFTPEAFKSILKPFCGSFVGFQGNEDFPHTIVGVGFRGATPPLAEFSEEYGRWRKSGNGSITQLVANLTPPIVLPLIVGLYRRLAGLTRRS
jgi:SAM-dependent methyltransferase